MSNSTGREWKVGDRVTLVRSSNRAFLPRTDTRDWMYGASATIKQHPHIGYTSGAQTLLLFDEKYRGLDQSDIACASHTGYIINTAELVLLRPDPKTSHSTWTRP